MLARKLLFWMLFFLSVISCINAIGVYDTRGDYIYYVSNPTPQINVSVQSTVEPIEIQDAKLILNGNTFEKPINNFLNPASEEKFIFTLADFSIQDPLNAADKIFFNMIALNPQRSQINPLGDPLEFEIIYDNIAPELIRPDENQLFLRAENSDKITLEFSEKIRSLKIRTDGTVVYDYTNPTDFLNNFSKNLVVGLEDMDLSEGFNTLELEFEDLAGNTNTKSLNLTYILGPLSISLVTAKENSDLKYFYDKNYPDYFNKTIYSEDAQFELNVQTSKPSRCYFSDTMISFDEFADVIGKEAMNTQDNRLHKISVDTTGTSKIWVACQSNVLASDIVYLNSILGFENQLINVKRFIGGELDIVSLYPSGLVTNLPFTMSTITNHKAVCLYSTSGNNYEDMDSEDYVTHQSELNPSVKNLNLRTKCFDYVYNLAEDSRNINIDTMQGVQVTSFSPKYSATSSVTVSLSLSEDASCRYSSKKEIASEFPNIGNSLNGTGLFRSFNVTSLSTGDNKYYIYCQKDNNVRENQINVIFDPNGPKIANLTFVNNGEQSDFIASTEELSFRVDVQSLIPVEKYYVEIEKANSTITRTVNSNDATIKEDLTDASKISVTAENLVGKNSSEISKSIKFDLKEPVTSFTLQGDSIKISCFDIESGCVKTLYGFSETNLNCNAILNYDYNSSIDIAENNYICARSFDRVGHEDFKQLALVAGFEINDSLEDLNISDEENETEEETDEGEDIEPFNPGLPGGNETDDNGVIVIASIFVLIAGLGGGGYYAYKKGYLNDQLKRLGVLKNQRGSKPASAVSTPKPSTPSQNNTKKSKYDEHIRKLNSFIDDTLDKRKSVFSSFESSSKGKNEKFEDTWTKGKSKSDKDSEFDEFYTGGKSNNAKNNKSMVEEAEDFEKYHKDKKEKDKKDE